jgi:hypothetical protein|tara:strand:- start:4829 stop:4990 length:162 start_codon:yes stop_codon:yes gene_type:complete
MKVKEEKVSAGIPYTSSPSKTTGTFVSSGAPIVKPTIARGSGAARPQKFRKNG